MVLLTVGMEETPTDDGAMRDGFAGQRMVVVPRPAVRAALNRPVTRRLAVTDAGHFPRAARHGRIRPAGAAENVLLVCTDGAGWCRLDGARLPVGRGDAVVLPARIAHEYGAAEERPWTLWWLHFTGGDADELVAALRASAGSPVSHLADPAPLASLVSQAIDGLDEATLGGLVAAAGAAWQALATLIATGRRPSGGGTGPVERALAHLRATSPRRTSVDELAAMVGLSTSQFAGLFKEQVGVPPLRYQSDLRMARARELLDTTDLSVAAVAEACGYDDPLYFSRQFTRLHSVAPSRYRQRPS